MKHRQFFRMNPEHKIQKSVFFRLTAILFIAGILILGILFGFFRSVWINSSVPPWKLHAIRYLAYVSQDIGNPPDTVKARDLSRHLMVSIRVVYPDGSTWATHRDLPVIHSADGADWARNYDELTYGEWDGRFLVLYKTGELTWLFEPDSRKLFDPDWKKILILFASLLLVLAGIFMAIRYILRPIHFLMDGIREISAGNLDVRFKERRHDEFGVISQTLNQMTEKITEMIRARDRLLLDVSHELRSPLTRVKVALELPDKTLAADLISSDIREMERMITELLETERLKSPHGGLNYSRFSLNEALPAFIKGLSGMEKISIILPESPVFIEADQDRLKTAIRNLTENAVKYGRSKVQIDVISGGSQTEIRISDDGDGIPDSDLQSVFEPFYRVDKSRTRATGGYGLGLSLVREIIHQHGGSVDIIRIPDFTTTFRVSLPNLKRSLS